ncbi:hypothetical protein BDQ17DRAFT_1355123 [Cyathus striatus]|nr:hypothetical protein BDQ17DRAFT_1355123 [Cyathus striatus]
MGAYESTMKLPRNPLEVLKYFDTVILAGDVLSELALTAARYDSDGIDIYFPNSKICGQRYTIGKAGSSEPSEVPHLLENLLSTYLKQNNALEILESILNAPPYQVGIQFVQIGTHASAGINLKKLDDDLKEKYQIRDIVDMTHVVTGKDLELSKILVGAVHREVDNKGIKRRFNI